MSARILTMPRNSLHDTLRQADTAQAIAGELASLVFWPTMTRPAPNSAQVPKPKRVAGLVPVSAFV